MTDTAPGPGDFVRGSFNWRGLTLLTKRFAGPVDQEVTFVLVPGIGVGSRYFGPLAQLLRSVATVYSLELPGMSKAPKANHAVSIEEYGALLAAFVEQLGVRRPIFVGHSMGAQVVVEASLQTGSTDDPVVLMGPVVNPRERSAFMQGLRLAQDNLFEPLSVLGITTTDYLRTGIRWYAKELPHMLGYPMVERSSRLSRPVLVIRGARDPIAPSYWSRRLAESVSEGDLREIPGEGHVVMYRSARAVADAIVRFAEIPHEMDGGAPGSRPTMSGRSGRARGSKARRTKVKRLNPVVIARYWMLDYAYATKGQLSRWSGPTEVMFSGHTRSDLPTPSPIVLLPGVYERWQFMRPVMERLTRLGQPIHTVAALGRNRRSIVDAARIVGDYLVRHDLHDVTIVAHSKGGLIGKQLMVLPEFAERVSSMVAISTPFSGSTYARYAFVPAIREFSPRDATTRQLSANFEVNSRITSIYNAFDPHIPHGCELVGATNVRLPDVGHFRILSNPSALDAIEAAIVRSE